VILLTGLTAAVIVQVFAVDHDLPLVFLVIALSVWAGARLPPYAAGMHALGVVGGAVLMLAAGAGGPLEDREPFQAVMVIQAMGVVALVVALFLSLAIQEKDLLSASLGVAARDARSRAELLATMTEAMVDGLVVVDARGVPLVVNEAAAALGADAWIREALGGSGRTGPFRRLDGSTLGIVEHPAWLALRGEATSSLDLVHTHPDTGERTVVSVSAAPVGSGLDRDEQLAVLLLRDVTARHRQLSQLRAFAGVVAHDLQNPLFASKGWAEVVAEGLGGCGGSVEPRVHDALRRTISSLGRAQLLVDDLLGFTRASTDAVDVRTIDLDALVETEMAELRVRFDRPDAVLEKGELGEVRMDPTLAGQVFANLLGNAVKYARPGSVPRVAIAVTRNARGVRINVSDDGPGIPPEHWERVFEPFHRVRPDVPGTGLGLAICAEAVERHGGTITLTEGPGGVGSMFSIHLPRG
jgi:signal transduction histidine kinase